MSEIADQYQKLVQFLNHCIDQYYNHSNSVISDEEYDRKYRRLIALEQTHPDLVSPDSPTQKIGAPANANFKKAKHPIRMYSLDNVFTDSDLNKFLKRFIPIQREFPEASNFYCDCKMDGLSLDLIYHEGKLSTAITRGDGIEGEDVTANAVMIPNIPKRIHTKDNIIVHGEIVVHRSDFYSVNRERDLKGLRPFSNTRNYASGSLLQKDPKVTKERLLRFYAWSLIHPSQKYPCDKQIELLIALGFNTPKGQLCVGHEDITYFINEISANRSKLPYDIDGVVIKANIPECKTALGWNKRAPLWATAWKFQASSQETTIEKITWNVGKSGKLTPTATLKPVLISGVKVSEVTLYNANYVEQNQLGVGAKVVISRSGDVIPKIEEILDPGKFDGLPTKCPICNHDLIRTESNVDLKCINPNCKAILKANLIYAVGKDALDIKGIGEQFVTELVDNGTIKKMTDVFSPLEGKNQEALDKLVTRMRNINLVELLTILGIQGMSRAIANKLVIEIINIDGLIKILQDPEYLKNVPLHNGVKKNMSLWYSIPEHQELLEDLRKLELTNCK